MTSLFEQYCDSFSINADEIRNCQRGAYYSILAHFTKSRKPCLVGLPTGSGKTALMMALCFGMRSKRTLIVTPATILRHQTFEKFKNLDDIRDTHAIPQDIPNPTVLEAVHEFQSVDEWNLCLPYEVIIATPNVTSSGYQRVNPPPKDLFDLLIVDEAHHSPAATWKELINTFSSAGTKSILLTGTPYRRDRIEIPADLVYDYPMGLAIDDGIYAPVKFINVRKTLKDRDLKLARSAIVAREQIKEKHGTYPLMLVKTDRKQHAYELCSIYKKQGLQVDAIHTDFSDEANRTTLEKIKNLKLDGVVAVGMLGEGLDVPLMKLAVFHRNPQSLPHTIQVIGRLSRSGTDIKEGVVVGYPDDFSRETFNLYDASPDWLRLIPELERKLIAGRVGTRNSGFLKGGEDFLFDSDLNPFFSVSAYKWSSIPSAAKLERIRQWAKYTKERSDTVERVSLFENDTVIAITKTTYQPDWIKSGGYSRIYQERFNLHLFFQYKEIILEYSTDPQIAGDLRNKLFTGGFIYLNSEMLTHALGSGDGSYIVVGLKNSAGFFQGVPRYKMLLGTEVQAGISISDSKVFHAGHCLMRIDRQDRDSEIRGIAYKKSRIWSLRRDNLRKFREWCLNVGETLLNENKVYLPGLEMLRKTENLHEFTAKPLALVHDPFLYSRKVEFIQKNSDTCKINCLPNMIITDWTNSSITFAIQALDVTEKINLGNSGDITFEKLSGADYVVIVDGIEGEREEYPLDEFFNEFNPMVLFQDGSTLVDGLYSKPTHIPEIPNEVFQSINWNDCDIYSEINNTKDGISIQEFMEKKYIPSRNPDLVIHDHNAQEIADAISIDMKRNVVSLYHMKSAKISGGKKELPGSRKDDIEEVLAQAICSGYWLKNIDFANELVRRVKERKATKIILPATTATLVAFANSYAPPLFNFEIVIVQPAIAKSKVSKAVKNLIACTYDYINAVNAKLTIICND